MASSLIRVAARFDRRESLMPHSPTDQASEIAKVSTAAHGAADADSPAADRSRRDPRPKKPRPGLY